METALGEAGVDRRVVEGCQKGDRQAFRFLYERLAGRVYSLALYFSGDETLAADITQQVFLKLFTTVSQYRYEADFSTWLYRIVANACADEKRARRRFVALGERPEPACPSVSASPHELCAQREVTDAVRAALASLKPSLRLPVLLRHLEGMSYEQIAVVMACSKGTVASRLNRGLRLLARKLDHLRGVRG